MPRHCTWMYEVNTRRSANLMKNFNKNYLYTFNYIEKFGTMPVYMRRNPVVGTITRFGPADSAAPSLKLQPT